MAPLTKKRLGKNLNKLVKQPAPPIANLDKAGSGAGSHRNGLWLLSAGGNSGSGGNSVNTNKSSSLSSTGVVSGLLSQKTSSVSSGPSLNTKSISNSAISTSDSAAALIEQQHVQHPPDAWGHVGTSPNHTVSTNLAAEVVPMTQQVETSSPVGLVDMHGNSLQSTKMYNHANENPSYTTTHDGQHQIHIHHSHPSSPGQQQEPQLRWDDYGGRGSIGDAPGASAAEAASAVDDQGLYMSRLAKERASRLQAEEEERRRDQQSRAAARLRELQNRQQAQSQQHLDTQSQIDVVVASKSTVTNRQLWEPPSTAVPSHVTTKASPQVIDGAAQSSNNHHHGSNGVEQQQSQYSGPVIHLNSYEDRDRGEQGKDSSTPRMLYDPKSGKMVAVKSREEQHVPNSNINNNNKSSRPNKKWNREEKKRNKAEGAQSHQLQLLQKEPSSGGGDLVNGRPRANSKGSHKSRKEDTLPSSSAVKSDDTNKFPMEVITAGFSAKKPPNSASPIEPSHRRLPRTCGVLYARDSNGNFYCADGCEGDLGYGAHSVPGGRARNPDAYAEFFKQHQRLLKVSDRPADSDEKVYDFAGVEFDDKDNDHKYGQNGTGIIRNPGLALYTGFKPAMISTNYDDYDDDDDDGDDERQPHPTDWVKADDRLELVTGVDDSPTLKPTAKEWAPSQAALAAAAAAAAEKKKYDASSSFISVTSDGDEDYMVSSRGEVTDDDDDEFDDDMDVGPFGLGFDPTQDMVGLMQSPSHGSRGDRLVASVDLGELALEPTVYSSLSGKGSTAGTTGGNIFAFGATGPWGSHQVGASANVHDWTLPSLSATGRGGLFGPSFHTNAVDQSLGVGVHTDDDPAASLISLAAGDTWGLAATSGLDGLALNAERPRAATGD